MDLEPDRDPLRRPAPRRGPVDPVQQHVRGVIRQLGPGELETRRAMADRLLVAEGAGHLADADGGPAWSIDPVPVVVPTAEWEDLAEGLAQRARVLDALLADLYGERRLLTTGVVPAELVLASPLYQRACAGTRPPAGR